MNELASLTRFENDGRWLQSHLAELRRKFTNQFVAVKDGDVIANDANADILIKKIVNKKEEPSQVLIEFIHKKDLKILL